jgi:hypothetical protein
MKSLVRRLPAYARDDHLTIETLLRKRLRKATQLACSAILLGFPKDHCTQWTLAICTS